MSFLPWIIIRKFLSSHAGFPKITLLRFSRKNIKTVLGFDIFAFPLIFEYLNGYFLHFNL